jgi:hypothetical protein
MREINLRLLITFSLSLAISIVTSFISNDATAGTRRCQNYSDNTFVCINEKGYKLYCRTEKGNGYDNTKTVCEGKGNYRKECIPTTQWTIRCIDSKGVKSNCKQYASSGVSYCQKSDGIESKCTSYDNDVTICNDIDKKGNPI